MGAWGTAISSNDTYADTYDEFFNHYNEGLDVIEISRILISENKETIENPVDSNNFWFALAKAQWECKQLDKELLNRIKKIIETGADIAVWRNLGANDTDIKTRREYLDKFLTNLQSERQKAKSRKKKLIRQPVFEKGDCLTFKLENGNYGGAVVLSAIKDSEYGQNLIAVTRINHTNKPIKKDFENAEVLIVNFGHFNSEERIHWYLPIRHKLVVHLIEIVDNIEVQLDYPYESNKISLIADFESWIIKQVDRQLQSEKIKQGPIIKKTIKEITKKNKWNPW